MIKSKTINFAVVMAMLTSFNGMLQMLAPTMSPDSFATLSIVIGMATAGGAVYLRTITTKPLSEK